MRLRFLNLSLCAAGLTAALAGQSAPFTPGNLAVYRVGDGAGSLVNTGSAVFIDEYTTSGTLVQSIAMPSSGTTLPQHPLVASGTATSEGLLTRSADGRFLLLTGYGRALGGSGSLSGTAAATVPRVVGRIDAQGAVDTTSALSDFADGNNPRSAVSTDGTTLWLAGGAGGIRTAQLGATTSLQIAGTPPDPANFRQLAIADGQLYFSTSSGSTYRIGAVGTGTPVTAGQSLSALPGLPLNGSPYAYVLLDLSAAVAGVDTLYVADDGNSAGTGIAKYALVGGSWVSNGQVGTDAEDYRGLTAIVSGSNVQLFALRRGGSGVAGGGELVVLTDGSGYNAALSGTPTLLATAAANTAFRGIARAPEAPVVLGPVMRITEFLYNGVDNEFIEFTNVGDQPADLFGWSFDDDSAVPNTQALSAFGVVQPGESVILAEAPAGSFRTAWNLCAGQKVIGGLTANLGGTDRIHLFDAAGAVVDQLAYSTTTQPTIVTTGNSAWVSLAALGQNQISGWTRSTLADSEASVASTGGDIGSPGQSNRALFDYDPCVTVPGVPSVTADVAATTPLLDLAVNGEGAVSATLDDPTDPARTLGLAFNFSDSDGAVADLVIAATSSNLAVVPAAGLELSGSGANRLLRITPAAVGLSVIRVWARDTSGKIGSYLVHYAVSAAALTPASTRFHTGASDASTAIALDASTMLVADDESQVLRRYRREVSGLHQAGFDFTSALGLTDLSGGLPREVDVEASLQLGSRIFWIGSHGNQATGSFNARPNRRRVFATELSGGALTYVGRYDFLAQDLIAWDQANGHGLGADALGLAASTAPNTSPELPTGFNIEGLALAGDGSAALLAFRAPRQTPATRDRALLIPIEGFDALVTGGTAGGSLPAGSAQIGAPILLDLGGRSIRSIERNAGRQYLIIAGPSGAATGTAPNDFRLYQWNGGDSAPILLPTDLTALASGGSFEGIVGLPTSFGPGVSVQLIVDNGDTIYYGNGVAAKDLAERRHAKFRSERITLDLMPLADPLFANGFENP